MRLTYDESPAENYAYLLSTIEPPPASLSVDPFTLSEWHNLMGLLLRRQLIEIAHSSPHEYLENVQQLHQKALLHFDKAIMGAMIQKDYERMQSYAFNLTYHLQQVISIGLSDLSQIVKWYSLVMNYTEKLDVGYDTAWEYITFSEFWLDNEQELKKMDEKKTQLELQAIVENLHPSKESFYQKGLLKVRSCADDRQHALMLISYLRFAKNYSSTNTRKLLLKELNDIFERSPKTKQEIIKDGYEIHLK